MTDNRPRNFAFPMALSIIAAAFLLMLTIAQETPVGSIKGRVTALETGNSLVASVYLTTLHAQPQDEKRFETESAKDGSFDITRVPAGEYKLEINSKAHKMEPVHITIEESRTKTIEAELPPVSPYMDLYVHQHIFTPDEKPQVTCRGFINSDAFTLNLYKVDLGAFLMTSGGSMERLLGVQSYYGGSGTTASVDLNANKSLTLTKSMQVPVNTRDIEGIFTQRIDLPVLAPGLYVAAVKSEGLQRLGWIMVTSIGLVAKTSGDGTLAYTVDLKTGAPIAGADVAVYVASKSVASGKTGVDGTLALPAAQHAEGENEQTLIAQKGDSVAFVSAWFDSNQESDSLIYAYTDRPVYRPGQKVQFKGIVRRALRDGYAVPASKPVTVEVRDSRDTLIYHATKTTNRFGSFHGDFDLNPETDTGYYTITSNLDGQKPGEPTSFQVAAYRKPEFNVKVDFAKKRYVRGDMVRATVSAQYYFGAPVPNAKVQYLIRRSPYWLFTGDQEEYMDGMEGGEYTDYGGYGEMVKEGEVTTDENGNAVVEFPADWPQPKGEYDWDSDQEFSIESTVTDRSDRYATGTGSTLVTRGEFAVDVTPDKYVVEPGSKVNVSIQAMDYDKHPVKNQGLRVLVGRMKWTQGESTFESMQDTQVTTDGAGRASVALSIDRPGDIRIQVTARDSRRNKIIGSEYVWSYSGESDYDQYASYPDLQIVTDKKAYNPGDTAKALINTKNPGATALVTIEGSRIFDRKTVKLKTKSTLVEIPIRDVYKPVFYIGVCFVKNKEFVSQNARAKVSLNTQTLRVKAAPSKKQYKPGEMASYKITATDARGKPAQAEFSLGVVDEAIYAIAEDSADPIVDFFYSKKPNRVNTSFSFPQIYLSDPDKAGAPLAQRPLMSGIRVRKRFLDTAYWNPSVMTNSRGEAVVSFRMPDNLTTWRATLRGITLDTACGESKSAVIARQDFMVRLETPRFLVQTDNAKITAVVHNYTGRDQNVELRMDAPGLKLDGGATRRVRVANGQIGRLDWNISAPNPGDHDITVRAAGDTAADAMQTTLPVYPHGVKRQTGTSSALTGTSNAKSPIIVRSDSIAGTTQLKIRMAPSLASAMLGSLDYLAQYPYGCTEQTTSSFLPDVILSRSFKGFGMRNPDLEKKLPDMVKKGLFRLYRFQLDDGGWGWCEYGKADPWMTAYVCYGLLQARDAGFPVNGDTLDRGISTLSKLVNQPKLSRDTVAFGDYVLALSGADVSQSLNALLQNQDLNSESLALAALAFQHSGQNDQAAKTLTRLLDRAAVSSDTMHWRGPDRYESSGIETTALALQAVIRANPKDPRIMQIVRWLMQRRQGDYWYSTRDTAMVLYAMSEFFSVSQELSPDFTATVYVNGKAVGGKRFTKASIVEPEYLITLRNGELHKGRNSLEIRKTGPGNLYFTTELDQYVTGDLSPITITGSGLTITRKYFRPSSRYYENSSEKNLGSPVSGCRQGDVLLVRLTINSSKYLSRLLAEDMIPAGCEIIDKGHVNPWEWSDWWVGQDVRDEKISFYLDELSPGKHVLTYQMRAGFSGEFHSLPAQVFAMYQPEVRASTAESEFRIR